MKFLDSNGVAILWAKIKDYVAENAGSGGGEADGNNYPTSVALSYSGGNLGVSIARNGLSEISSLMPLNWSSLYGKPSNLVTNVEINGSGNAVTNAAFSGGVLTLTKGNVSGGGTVTGDYLPLSGGTLTGTLNAIDSYMLTTTGIIRATSKFIINDKNFSRDIITIDSNGITKGNLSNAAQQLFTAGGTTTQLKTINGESLLGEGDITISGGSTGNYLPLSGGFMNNNSSISIASGDADTEGDRYGARINSDGVFVGNLGDTDDTHIQITRNGIESSLNDESQVYTTDGGTSEFVKSIFGTFKKNNYFTTDQINVHFADNSGEIHIEYGQLDPDPETFETFVRGGIYWHAHSGGTGLDFYSNSNSQTSSNIQSVLNIYPTKIAFATENGVNPGIVTSVKEKAITFYIAGNGYHFRDKNTTTAIDDDWVSDHISDIFDTSTSDVTPHSPHILDMDRTNKCMLVRFEVDDSEQQVYTISIVNGANDVVTRVPCGGDYKAMFVVPVYYNSDGSANMYYKYKVNW